MDVAVRFDIGAWDGMCSGGESLMIVKIFSYLKYLHQHRLGGVGNIPIDIKFF